VEIAVRLQALNATIQRGDVASRKRCHRAFVDVFMEASQEHVHALYQAEEVRVGAIQCKNRWLKRNQQHRWNIRQVQNKNLSSAANLACVH
jgi:hypothetical protein